MVSRLPPAVEFTTTVVIAAATKPGSTFLQLPHHPNRLRHASEDPILWRQWAIRCDTRVRTLTGLGAVLRRAALRCGFWHIQVRWLGHEHRAYGYTLRKALRTHHHAWPYTIVARALVWQAIENAFPIQALAHFPALLVIFLTIRRRMRPALCFNSLHDAIKMGEKHRQKASARQRRRRRRSRHSQLTALDQAWTLLSSPIASWNAISRLGHTLVTALDRGWPLPCSAALQGIHMDTCEIVWHAPTAMVPHLLHAPGRNEELLLHLTDRIQVAVERLTRGVYSGELPPLLQAGQTKLRCRDTTNGGPAVIGFTPVTFQCTQERALLLGVPECIPLILYMSGSPPLTVEFHKEAIVFAAGVGGPLFTCVGLWRVFARLNLRCHQRYEDRCPGALWHVDEVFRRFLISDSSTACGPRLGARARLHRNDMDDQVWRAAWQRTCLTGFCPLALDADMDQRQGRWDQRCCRCRQALPSGVPGCPRCGCPLTVFVEVAKQSNSNLVAARLGFQELQ